LGRARRETHFIGALFRGTPRSVRVMERSLGHAGTSTSCSFVGRQCTVRPILQGRASSTKVCAKKEIHPKYYKEAKVICNGEEVLVTSGTMESYTVDVWSGNHPFYTKSDTAMLSDEGRVNKFSQRYAGLSMSTVAAMKPGDKKLDYKPPSKLKKKGGKK